MVDLHYFDLSILFVDRFFLDAWPPVYPVDACLDSWINRKSL